METSARFLLSKYLFISTRNVILALLLTLNHMINIVKNSLVRAFLPLPQ